MTTICIQGSESRMKQALKLLQHLHPQLLDSLTSGELSGLYTVDKVPTPHEYLSCCAIDVSIWVIPL